MLHANNIMSYANNGSCQICTSLTFSFDSLKSRFGGTVTNLRKVFFIVSER